MSFAKRILNISLPALMLLALTLSTALAGKKGIEFSTQSADAVAAVDELTEAIESFVPAPTLAQIAQKVIDADPNWGLGYMTMSQFQPAPQAQESLDKAEELSGSMNAAEKKYLEGVKAIRAGDPVSALETFREIAKEYPGERRAHMLVGQIQMGRGEVRSAHLAFNRAARLDDDTARVHAFIGNCYLLKGEYKNAAKAFKKSVKKAADGTLPFQSYFGRAFTYLHLGKVDKALASVEAMHKLYEDQNSPFGPPVFMYNLRARINLENGRYDQALNLYEQGHEAVRNSQMTDQQKQIWIGRYYHGKGRTLARMGKHQEAWKEAESVKKMIDQGGPTAAQFEPAYHYLAGYCKLEAGDYRSAIEHLEQSSPTDPFQRLLLARAYYKAGQKDKARQAYQQVTQINQVTVERALAFDEAREMLSQLGG